MKTYKLIKLKSLLLNDKFSRISFLKWNYHEDIDMEIKTIGTIASSLKIKRKRTKKVEFKSEDKSKKIK